MISWVIIELALMQLHAYLSVVQSPDINMPGQCVVRTFLVNLLVLIPW